VNSWSFSVKGTPQPKGSARAFVRDGRAIVTSEADFQRTVIEYAKLRGWLVHHTRTVMERSGKWATPIQGDPGFPDLVLARQDQVIFIELKSERGKATEGQIAWADAIGGVLLFRPSDWPAIEAVLL